MIRSTPLRPGAFQGKTSPPENGSPERRKQRKNSQEKPNGPLLASCHFFSDKKPSCRCKNHFMLMQPELHADEIRIACLSNFECISM